jgi:hypothetical protein
MCPFKEDMLCKKKKFMKVQKLKSLNLFQKSLSQIALKVHGLMKPFGVNNMKKLFLLIITVFLLGFSGSALIRIEASTSRPYTVNGVFDGASWDGLSGNANRGDSLSFTLTGKPDGHDFAFWIINGVVRKDLPLDYEYTITTNNVLQIVFTPTGKFAAVFIDSNGKYLGVKYTVGGAVTDTELTVPAARPGFVPVTGSGKWTSIEGSETINNVTQNSVFVLNYQVAETPIGAVTLSLTNGTASIGSPVPFNSLVTITADAAPAEQVFAGWTENGEIVSYDPQYKITALYNRTLVATYAASVTPQPIVTLSTDLRLRSGHHSYVGQFSLPSGYSLIEYGFLYKNVAEVLLTHDTSGVQIAQSSNRQTATNEFVSSFALNSHVSVRAYVQAFNPSNQIVTIYSSRNISYDVVNKGFESGDQTGWTAYSIWKNESGMRSFEGQNRIVNNTYFGSNPYGRDGDYNLGHVWSGCSWSQCEERMGHLRSTNFTLGGSGWISFKLGGGRNQAFAYVSVRNATTHVEVARFGNRHRNDTSLATTQYGSSISNAEAYLYQYYFNLGELSSTNFGERYYFVLTEASSFEWAVLSADSFFTYYSAAPEEGSGKLRNSDTLAENIVPVIEGIGSATNQVPDGNPFISGLTSWTGYTRDGSFGFSTSGGDHARSDGSGGDGVTGVLRSSAFSINGDNKHLVFDFAGGRSHDKQIFITIREVGTNVEVMRLVRNPDRAQETNDFSNHTADLSGLSSDKLYYIEISDNRTGGWGIIRIRNLRLQTTAGSNACEIITDNNRYLP